LLVITNFPSPGRARPGRFLGLTVGIGSKTSTITRYSRRGRPLKCRFDRVFPHVLSTYVFIHTWTSLIQRIQWVTLSLVNTKDLHQSLTPNPLSNRLKPV